MRGWWRTAGWIVLFWALEALYSSAEVVYRSSFSKEPYPWSKALVSEFTYACFGALLSPALLWLARRFPVGGRVWFRRVLLHLAAGTVFACALKVLWDLLVPAVRPPYLAGPFSWRDFLWSMAVYYDGGMVFYAIIVLAVFAGIYYKQYEQSLVEAAQLQTQLVQAQLAALRAQLDPHFLFNTLHSISELVHADPEGAEQMIARLSTLLRHSLESSHRPEVPLGEELGFLRLYLDIEKARFDERLRIRYDVAPAAEQALVPTLILQPLAENAIRHGISKSVAGGEIGVGAKRVGDRLTVWIRDNGAGLPDQVPPREGVGLRTARGRLTRLYGGGCRFELKQMDPGAEVRFEIPFRQAESEREGVAYAAL